MGNQNNRIPLLPYAVNLRKRDREREGETGRERQGEGGREGERGGCSEKYNITPFTL